MIFTYPQPLIQFNYLIILFRSWTFDCFCERKFFFSYLQKYAAWSNNSVLSLRHFFSHFIIIVRARGRVCLYRCDGNLCCSFQKQNAVVFSFPSCAHLRTSFSFYSLIHLLMSSMLSFGFQWSRKTHHVGRTPNIVYGPLILLNIGLIVLVRGIRKIISQDGQIVTVKINMD